MLGAFLALLAGFLLTLGYSLAVMFRDAAREVRERQEAEHAEQLAKAKALADARLRRRALSRLANTLKPGMFVEMTVEKRLKPKYGKLVRVEDDSALYITLQKFNGRVIVVKDPLTVRVMSLLEVLAYESAQGAKRRS